MATINFYGAVDMLQPIVPVDPSYINYYSVNNGQIWAGTGSFGSSVDIRIDGYNLTNSFARVTGAAGYYNGQVAMSIYDFDAAWAEVSNALTAGWSGIVAGNDKIVSSDAADRILAGDGADSIFSFGGDDYIYGNRGADYIDAGDGNDAIRGGNGPDQIIGGSGSDWIWGGRGANSVWAGDLYEDGAVDSIFVPVDSVLNPIGNPGGIRRDLLNGIESIDRIYLHGVEDSALTFRDGVSDPLGEWEWTGVGIFVNGTLEAIVTDELSANQVNDITAGGFFG